MAATTLAGRGTVMPRGRVLRGAPLVDDDPQIEVEPDLEGRVVVIVHGALDLPEVGPLRAVLGEICATDCPAVVIDLTNVNFIGSSGIGAILQARQQLDALGRTLVLRGAAPTIRRAFQITHLEDLLDFEEPA